MVLVLPLLIALVCLPGSAIAPPPPKPNCAFGVHPLFELAPDTDSLEASVRAERSANISHIVGTSRKIQLIVSKTWFLQIHPDGVVNGTDTNFDSDFCKFLFMLIFYVRKCTL